MATTIAIARAQHDRDFPFVQVNLEVVKALPVAALGALVKLLSFADGWEIDADRLKRDYNVPAGAWRTVEKSLRSSGFLSKEKQFDEKHRVAGSVWKLVEFPPQFHHAKNDTMEFRIVDNRHDGIDGQDEAARASINTLPKSLKSLIAAEQQPADAPAQAALNDYAQASQVVVDFGPDELEVSMPQALSGLVQAAIEQVEPAAGGLDPLMYLVGILGDMTDAQADRYFAEMSRLGAALTDQVLDRCRYSRDWMRVLDALENEAGPNDEPAAAPELSTPITFPPLEDELKPAGAITAVSAYENEIGRLTYMVGQEVADLVSTYTEAWVIDAIREAALQNVRKLAYVRSILANWHKQGRNSPKPGTASSSKPATGRFEDVFNTSKFYKTGLESDADASFPAPNYELDEYGLPIFKIMTDEELAAAQTARIAQAAIDAHDDRKRQPKIIAEIAELLPNIKHLLNRCATALNGDSLTIDAPDERTCNVLKDNLERGGLAGIVLGDNGSIVVRHAVAGAA